jgi:hypothetical protein
MKVAVVGSRDFPRLDLVRQFVWEQERTTVIVTGGAHGVDEAALMEARRLGMDYELYLPEWQIFGKRAGALRNQQIVDAADEVVAFWDGKSRGTQITMDMAKRAGKPLKVISSSLDPLQEPTP